MLLGTRDREKHPPRPTAPITVTMQFDNGDEFPFVAETENDGTATVMEGSIQNWAFAEAERASVLRIWIGSEQATINVSGISAGAEAFLHFCSMIVR